MSSSEEGKIRESLFSIQNSEFLTFPSIPNMAHQISTRISLRWLPDPPSEPTDTLVFNVGAYFLDLRVLKADRSIDWAMAGERQILSEDPRKPLILLSVDIISRLVQEPPANFEHIRCSAMSLDQDHRLVRFLRAR